DGKRLQPAISGCPQSSACCPACVGMLSAIRRNPQADTAGVEKLVQGTASSAFAQAAGNAAQVNSFAFQFTGVDGVTLGAVAGQQALVFTGTPGNDILVGSPTGNNIIEGKAGNDT